MDNNKKMLLIGGGVLAVGAIFLIARSAKAQSNPVAPPVLPPNPNPNRPDVPIVAYTPPTDTTTNNAPITGSVKVYGANGMNSAQITCVQKALTKAGYNTQGIDGTWGVHTAQALANYQRDNGLIPSGTFDGNTANSKLGECLKAGPMPGQMITPGGGGGGTTLQSDAVATEVVQQTQPTPDQTQVAVGDTSFNIQGYPGTVNSGCNSDGAMISASEDRYVRNWIDGETNSMNLQMAAAQLDQHGCSTLGAYARARATKLFTSDE